MNQQEPPDSHSEEEPQEGIFESYLTDTTIYIIIRRSRLQASNFTEFKMLLDRSWITGLTQAVVDMRTVQFIDSAGICALLSIYRRFPKKESAVTLINTQPLIRSILKLNRCDVIFAIDSAWPQEV